VSHARSRKRILSLRQDDDIVMGDFVRHITGGPLLMVASVTNEHAKVAMLHKGWGWYEIVPCDQLMRVVRP
jgi:hypothetical protein